jgi:hypothetical protein
MKILTQITIVFEKTDHNIGFQTNRKRLVKIAPKIDHNVDPLIVGLAPDFLTEVSLDFSSKLASDLQLPRVTPKLGYARLPG